MIICFIGPCHSFNFFLSFCTTDEFRVIKQHFNIFYAISVMMEKAWYKITCCSRKIIDLVNDAMANPVLPPADDDGQSVESRVICSTNVIHQSDCILRQLVTERISEIKGQLLIPLCLGISCRVLYAKEKHSESVLGWHNPNVYLWRTSIAPSSPPVCHKDQSLIFCAVDSMWTSLTVFQILRQVVFLCENDDIILSYISVVLNCIGNLLYLAVCMPFIVFLLWWRLFVASQSSSYLILSWYLGALGITWRMNSGVHCTV